MTWQMSEAGDRQINELTSGERKKNGRFQRNAAPLMMGLLKFMLFMINTALECVLRMKKKDDEWVDQTGKNRSVKRGLRIIWNANLIILKVYFQKIKQLMMQSGKKSKSNSSTDEENAQSWEDQNEIRIEMNGRETRIHTSGIYDEEGYPVEECKTEIYRQEIGEQQEEEEEGWLTAEARSIITKTMNRLKDTNAIFNSEVELSDFLKDLTHLLKTQKTLPMVIQAHLGQILRSKYELSPHLYRMNDNGKIVDDQLSTFFPKHMTEPIRIITTARGYGIMRYIKEKEGKPYLRLIYVDCKPQSNQRLIALARCLKIAVWVAPRSIEILIDENKNQFKIKDFETLLQEYVEIGKEMGFVPEEVETIGEKKQKNQQEITQKKRAVMEIAELITTTMIPVKFMSLHEPNKVKNIKDLVKQNGGDIKSGNVHTEVFNIIKVQTITAKYWDTVNERKA